MRTIKVEHFNNELTEFDDSKGMVFNLYDEYFRLIENAKGKILNEDTHTWIGRKWVNNGDFKKSSISAVHAYWGNANKCYLVCISVNGNQDDIYATFRTMPEAVEFKNIISNWAFKPRSIIRKFFNFKN